MTQGVAGPGHSLPYAVAEAITPAVSLLLLATRARARLAAASHAAAVLEALDIPAAQLTKPFEGVEAFLRSNGVAGWQDDALIEPWQPGASR
jgi:hypothetical protein